MTSSAVCVCRDRRRRPRQLADLASPRRGGTGAGRAAALDHRRLRRQRRRRSGQAGGVRRRWSAGWATTSSAGLWPTCCASARWMSRLLVSPGWTPARRSSSTSPARIAVSSTPSGPTPPSAPPTFRWSAWPDCKVLYLGGYLLMERRAGGRTGRGLRRRPARPAHTVLDVVTPGPGDYLPRLEKILPEVDVFLPNDHEAELILGEKDPLRQAEMFHRMGATDGHHHPWAIAVRCWSARVRLRADVPGAVRGRHRRRRRLRGRLHRRPAARACEPAGCLRMASAVGASCVRAIGTTTGVFTRTELRRSCGRTR